MLKFTQWAVQWHRVESLSSHWYLWLQHALLDTIIYRSCVSDLYDYSFPFCSLSLTPSLPPLPSLSPPLPLHQANSAEEWSALPSAEPSSLQARATASAHACCPALLPTRPPASASLAPTTSTSRRWLARQVSCTPRARPLLLSPLLPLPIPARCPTATPV